MVKKISEYQEHIMFLLHDSALLNPEGCATLKNLAPVFGVSPSTVSLHINRARHKQYIHTLEAENSELKAELQGRDVIRRVS